MYVCLSVSQSAYTRHLRSKYIELNKILYVIASLAFQPTGTTSSNHSSPPYTKF